MGTLIQVQLYTFSYMAALLWPQNFWKLDFGPKNVKFSKNLKKLLGPNDDDDYTSQLQQKASLLNLFEHLGEYFQSIRILIKHWQFLHKNWQMKTPESESEKRHIGVQQ